MKKILFFILSVFCLLTSCHEDIIGGKVPCPNKTYFRISDGTDTLMFVNRGNFEIIQVSLLNKEDGAYIGAVGCGGSVMNLIVPGEWENQIVECNGDKASIMYHDKSVLSVKRTGEIVDTIDLHGYCLITRIKDKSKALTSYEIKPYDNVSDIPYHVGLSVASDDTEGFLVVSLY